jgi:hypothetical protein
MLLYLKALNCVGRFPELCSAIADIGKLVRKRQNHRLF